MYNKLSRTLNPHIGPVDEVPVDAWTKSLGKYKITSSQRNSLPDGASMMPRITCFRLIPPSQNALLPSEHQDNLLRARKLQSRNTHHVAEEFSHADHCTWRLADTITLQEHNDFSQRECQRSIPQKSVKSHFYYYSIESAYLWHHCLLNIDSMD